jgi:hypothetical protein
MKKIYVVLSNEFICDDVIFTDVVAVFDNKEDLIINSHKFTDTDYIFYELKEMSLNQLCKSLSEEQSIGYAE